MSFSPKPRNLATTEEGLSHMETLSLPKSQEKSLSRRTTSSSQKKTLLFKSPIKNLIKIPIKTKISLKTLKP